MEKRRARLCTLAKDERVSIDPPKSAGTLKPIGDAGAFAATHARLNGWIKRLMLERSGRADVADDLTQRTWTAVWAAVTSGRYDERRAGLSTFVYAVAQNVWRQRAKEDARFQRNDRTPIECEPSADVVLAEAELIDRMRRVLRDEQALTQQERWILRLIGSGVTDRTLAAELGVSPSTAHERKKAVLAKLRALLEPAERGGVVGEEQCGETRC